MIIIDEISMVKTDMFFQLDLRLQEIKKRIGISFGSISIFCFYMTFKLDSLWRKFSVLNLEINHRQGKDEEYADMLNKVREGKQIEADIEQLKGRIRP